jgi:hypothetical protein
MMGVFDHSPYLQSHAKIGICLSELSIQFDSSLKNIPVGDCEMMRFVYASKISQTWERQSQCTNVQSAGEFE